MMKVIRRVRLFLPDITFKTQTNNKDWGGGGTIVYDCNLQLKTSNVGLSSDLRYIEQFSPQAIFAIFYIFIMSELVCSRRGMY